LEVQQVETITGYQSTKKRRKTMETRVTFYKVLSICIGALILGGCAASYQARNVEMKESVLVNPGILQKGGDDQALYRYVNPNAQFKQYSKLIIDPVMIVKDAELSDSERENYQKLANNAYVYLHKALEVDYQIVAAPEPGTMRLQLAIIDADTSKPVRNLLSSISPIGIGLSLVKYTVTGKQSGVGEITAEMKVTDATTGELLGAALDRRVGGKAAKGIIDTWYNADQALDYWARQTRFNLCNERGGSDCVKP
jgi:hypothetical protein